MICSVQTQAVLYNNDIDALIRSLDSIANAIQVEQRTTHYTSSNIVSYGDASPHPLFSREQVDELTNRYKSSFDFRYQYFDENTGFGKGNNLLGLDAPVSHLLIINPDVVLSPRFFSSHLKPFEDRDVGIVEGRQTPIEHPKEYDLETGETDWASGACMCIPQELFKQLDGFDSETFFMYCEDVDISWRVRMLDKKVIYQPLDPIFHSKHLNEKGKLIANNTEMYHSAEANLLIAYKWSNFKRLEELLDIYDKSPEEHLQKAASVFKKRREANQLPTPIDPEHKASTFKPTGEYSLHRYGL